MERYYRIAGITVRITGDDKIMNYDDAFLGAYSISPSKPDYTMEFEAVSELSPPEGDCIFSSRNILVYGIPEGEIRYTGSLSQGYKTAEMRMQRCKNSLTVQALLKGYFKSIGARAILNCIGIEHLMTESGRFIQHASYIKYKNEAILFTAPSGTGKSTQAQLWCDYRGAELINGDRAAIVPENGTFFAHGVPYSGSSGVCKNESYPIKAIVYLSQATENTVTRLNGLAAFRKIWEGCTADVWNKVDMEACIKTVSTVTANIPIFHLACLPDETAVKALENEFEKL